MVVFLFWAGMRLRLVRLYRTLLSCSPRDRMVGDPWCPGAHPLARFFEPS